MSESGKPSSSIDLHSLEIARQRLSMYFRLARGFQPAPHQVKILREVQQFIEECWATPPGQAEKLRVLVVNLPPGAGKGVQLDMNLPTPEGFVKAIDVQPGDYLYDATGQLT